MNAVDANDRAYAAPVPQPAYDKQCRVSVASVLTKAQEGDNSYCERGDFNADI